MLDTYFRPSDKFRDVCRSSVTFSALSIFFARYGIPLASFPLLTLNLDPRLASDALKNVNIDGLIGVIATFYYLQTIILYITEYIDFTRPVELQLAEALEKARLAYHTDPEMQRAFNSSQRRLGSIHRWNVINSYVRFLLDFVLPTCLFIVAMISGGKNLWIFLANSA